MHDRCQVGRKHHQHARARQRFSKAVACFTWLAACGCGGGADIGALRLADGLDALARGDTVAARAELDEALFHDPTNPRALFHGGRLWAARGDFEGRARGEALLRRAVDRAPEVGVYRAALGEVLHEQRFHHESAAACAAAVKLDSSLSRAWFLLGVETQRRWLQEPDETAVRDSALRCYAHAWRADPSDEESLYRLAFLHMVRGEFDHARELVTPRAYERDCPSRFGLLLAAIDARSGRVGGASNILAATLRCLPASEREVVLGLRSVLHPDSADSYADRSVVARESLAAVFWFERDPTPATLANERILEHVTRVLESDFYFSVPELARRGAASDRGEVYIRYGPPSIVERDVTLQVPAWRWIYGEAAGFSIDFLDPYHNGDYRRRRRHVWSNFAQLEPMEAQPEITLVGVKRPAQPTPHLVRYFRGEGGVSALEIAFELPLDPSITAVRVEAAGWMAPGQLGSASDLVLPRTDFFPLEDGRAVGRVRLEVPDAAWMLGLECTALKRITTSPEVFEPQWTSAGREHLESQSFRADALALSDLVLAHRIEAGEGGPFDFGGVRVVPRVGTTIAEGRLQLYFEVYPSRAMQLEHRPLAITYRVLPQPPSWRFRQQFRATVPHADRPAVAATFTLMAEESVQRQRLGIDVRALEPGDYRLVVEVRDPLDGSTTSRATGFTLPAPSSARAD